MSIEINQYVNEWELESWIEHKNKIKDCVAIDGVLLSHSNESRVYFAPEIGYGVRFELEKADILDILPHPEPIIHYGQTFSAVKVLLKKDAVVTLISIHVASGLIDFVSDLREYVKAKDVVKQNHAYTDTLNHGNLYSLLNRDIGVNINSATPTPTPLPPAPKEPPPERKLPPRVPPAVNVRG